MAFRDVLNRIGIGVKAAKPSKPNPTRVAMPVQVGMTGGSSRFSGSGLQFWGDNIEGYDALINGAFDYEGAVGDYTDNSAVAACLAFIITAFASTTLCVGEKNGSEYIPDEKHPLLDLLANPHPDFDGQWLLSLLIRDYWDRGNHYWNLVTAGVSGAPIEIQPLLGALTEPVKLSNDSTRILDHYRYQPGTGSIDIPAERVVHFRYSIPDTSDPLRLGARPLCPARREVYADNKASEVAAAILRRPQPSGILSPESSDIEVTQEDMDAIKRGATEASSGQNAGSVIGLSAGVKFQPLSFSPRDLALDEARVKPEERICALFNIPPVVVGLGAGLKHSTYNNGETAHQAAWKNCVIPFQDYIAFVLTEKLLPLYPGSEKKVVYWDRSHVGILQEDTNLKRKEAREDYKTGIITVEEARGEGGREAVPTEGTLQAPATMQPTAIPVDAPPSAVKSLRLKRSNGSIYDATDRLRAALMADEQDAIQALASAYNRVSRDLQKQIDALIAEYDANPDALRSSALSRATALAEQVEISLLDFADRGAAITEDGQRSAMATTLSNAERITRAALGTPPAGIEVAFNALPSDAIEVLVGMAGNGSPLTALFESAAREFAVEVREILISSFAQGVGPREVARRMAGASGSNRARMETICRTEMLRASREASRRSYEENQHIVNGYVRLSAADMRTCAACWALHGKKYATNERFAQHPQCRCQLIPDVKSYAEILGDPTIPDTRKTIPAGEDIFANLSSAEQEEILGPGLYDLYKGGASLSDFVHSELHPEWGPSVTVSTVAAAAARAEIYL